jgi:hypothetical protein
MATPDVKKSLALSRKIPTKMKELIEKYLTASSRYKNGIITGLRKPDGMGNISKKISGVSMGADAKGFFVYTHRARCGSHVDPLKITKKEIDFIESTG